MQTATSEQQLIKMTTWPLPKLLAVMSLPTIANMLATSIYNLADTYFVAKIGTSASGAVGIVYSIMAIIQMIGFSFGMGGGSVISLALGNNDIKKANCYLASSFTMAAICGFLVSVLGSIFVKPLCLLFGSTPTILPYAIDYARFILISAPFYCMEFTVNSCLRYQGKANLSMIGILTGGIVNIILDPICIFVLDLGIKGAAIATAISQIVSFLIMFYLLQSKRSMLHLNLRNTSKDVQVYTTILKRGFPTTCRQGLSCLAATLMNNKAKIFGDALVASLSICNRINNVIYGIVIGVGQGLQPISGFNYGAKKYDRVKKSYNLALGVSTVFCLIAAVIIGLNSQWIMEVFRKEDAEVVRYGVYALRFVVLAMPLIPMSVFTNMVLQVIGKSFAASILASIRSGFAFLPLLYILSAAMQANGIVITQALADVCNFVISIPAYFYYFHGKHSIFPQTD